MQSWKKEKGKFFWIALFAKVFHFHFVTPSHHTHKWFNESSWIFQVEATTHVKIPSFHSLIISFSHISRLQSVFRIFLPILLVNSVKFLRILRKCHYSVSFSDPRMSSVFQLPSIWWSDMDPVCISGMARLCKMKGSYDFFLFPRNSFVRGEYWNCFHYFECFFWS